MWDHRDLFLAEDVNLYFVKNKEPEKVFEQDSDIIRVVRQEDYSGVVGDRGVNTDSIASFSASPH